LPKYKGVRFYETQCTYLYSTEISVYSRAEHSFADIFCFFTPRLAGDGKKNGRTRKDKSVFPSVVHKHQTRHRVSTSMYSLTFCVRARRPRPDGRSHYVIISRDGRKLVTRVRVMLP